MLGAGLCPLGQLGRLLVERLVVAGQVAPDVPPLLVGDVDPTPPTGQDVYGVADASPDDLEAAVDQLVVWELVGALLLRRDAIGVVVPGVGPGDLLPPALVQHGVDLLGALLRPVPVAVLVGGRPVVGLGNGHTCASSRSTVGYPLRSLIEHIGRATLPRALPALVRKPLAAEEGDTWASPCSRSWW